jgi:hypothetical protein
MKIELELSDVTVRTPAVAVVGTWDPVVDAHRELFQRLASRGKRIKCVPVVIVLFPPPTRFLNPDGLCLEYTDIKSRVALIQECARVKVLAIRFQRQDLDSSCRSFFDLVRTRVSLRELWLGATQSLGRGPQGSGPAISALARKRNIVLRRMDVCHRSHVGRKALALLEEGKVSDAIKCAGHAPIWGRPRSGVLRLDWPPGKYLAVPVAQPLFKASPDGMISLRLSPGGSGRRQRLEWPGPDVAWLAFLAGPADRKAFAKRRSGRCVYVKHR